MPYVATSTPSRVVAGSGAGLRGGGRREQGHRSGDGQEGAER